MAKQTKRTKKFVKNNLDRTIKERKDRQKKNSQIQKSSQAKKQKALRNTSKKGGAATNGARHEVEDDKDEGFADNAKEDEEVADVMSEDNDDRGKQKGKSKRMTVDDFLGGGFEEEVGSEEDAEEDDEDETGNEAASLEDIDDLSDDEETHVQDLQKLAKNDPEFFRYLQENDKDLLKFGEEEDDEVMEEEEEMSADAAKSKGKAKGEKEPEVVTADMLRRWQRSMLQTHSLRAFRRLLLAFRAAARMGDEEDQQQQTRAGSIQYVVTDASVFNKLIITTLKYAPVVLQQHLPYKEMPNGKYKLPTSDKKYGALQRSVQSFFGSLHQLLKTLPEPKMLYVCVSEGTKMIPYLMANRRLSRDYVKILLDLWSRSKDNVRIAAFLAVRRVATAGDEVVMDLCLRGAYHAFVRSCRSTTIHTLPSINLMKNSASELYSLDMAASYEHAFSFIRQLAVHLRNCLKSKSKESYQAVYNWQYVHCLDFWSLVLSQTCNVERRRERGEEGESAMQPLIYPLVQAATGAIRLLPTSRYYPFRFHVMSSLLRLMQRTGVYIPLAPLLVEMFDSPELQRKPKPSTLSPLNLEIAIRVPANYTRTKVYADQLAQEASHLVLEFFASQSRNIAFVELVVPPIVQLRRLLKTGGKLNSKLVTNLKPVLDKIGQNAEWIKKKRDEIEFAPDNIREVERFLMEEKEEAPLEVAFRLAKKVRKQKNDLLNQSSQQVD